jgi:hypothetical protein
MTQIRENRQKAVFIKISGKTHKLVISKDLNSEDKLTKGY